MQKAESERNGIVPTWAFTWLITSWDGVARRQKPFSGVCNLWSIPQHHVLSLHWSRSCLTWSPIGQEQHGQTPNKVLPDTLWLLSALVWNTHLWGRKWNAAETARAPHAGHLQVPVPARKAADARCLVSHLGLWMSSLEKIPFLFFFRHYSGSIKPLLLRHWTVMRLQWFGGSCYWSPLIWNRKSYLPLTLLNLNQLVSYMRHPLVFYLIISVTLQYETFSNQSLCVGGREYFQLIAMVALAQAVAAGRGLQAPLSNPSSSMLLAARQC